MTNAVLTVGRIGRGIVYRSTGKAQVIAQEAVERVKSLFPGSTDTYLHTWVVSMGKPRIGLQNHAFWVEVTLTAEPATRVRPPKPSEIEAYKASRAPPAPLPLTHLRRGKGTACGVPKDTYAEWESAFKGTMARYRCLKCEEALGIFRQVNKHLSTIQDRTPFTAKSMEDSL